MHDETMPRLEENQARWDRQLRIGIAIALFVLGLSGLFGDTVGAVLRISALVPLVTGAFGWCPVYEALGFSTRGARARGARGVPELREERA